MAAFFGRTRFEAAVLSAADAPPAELLTAVLGRLAGFTKGAMPADDVKGLFRPGRRQLRPAARFVMNPAGLIEPLEHASDGRGFDGE